MSDFMYIRALFLTYLHTMRKIHTLLPYFVYMSLFICAIACTTPEITLDSNATPGVYRHTMDIPAEAHTFVLGYPDTKYAAEQNVPAFDYLEFISF